MSGMDNVSGQLISSRKNVSFYINNSQDVIGKELVWFNVNELVSGVWKEVSRNYTIIDITGRPYNTIFD